MRNKIGIVLLSMLFVSCDRTADFVIVNSSDSSISNIKIGVAGSPTHDEVNDLAAGDSAECTASLWSEGGDGSYRITYTFQDSNVEHTRRFGYFTSKTPMEKLTKIFIYNDTIVIDEVL